MQYRSGFLTVGFSIGQHEAELLINFLYVDGDESLIRYPLVADFRDFILAHIKRTWLSDMVHAVLFPLIS